MAPRVKVVDRFEATTYWTIYIVTLLLQAIHFLWHLLAVTTSKVTLLLAMVAWCFKLQTYPQRQQRQSTAKTTPITRWHWTMRSAIKGEKPVYASTNKKRKVVSWRLFFSLFVAIIHKPFYFFITFSLTIFFFLTWKKKDLPMNNISSVMPLASIQQPQRYTVAHLTCPFFTRFLLCQPWLVGSIHSFFLCSLVIVN